MRPATWNKPCKTSGAELPEALGVCLPFWHVQCAGPGVSKLIACPLRFHIFFGLVTPFYLPITPFWDRNVCSVSLQTLNLRRR
jgi:hypothetical protein